MQLWGVLWRAAMGSMMAFTLSLAHAQSQTPQQAPSTPPAAAPAKADVPPTLAQMTPRSLSGMAVIGKDDATVGRVDAVMRDRATNALQLVVQTNEGQRMTLNMDGIEASNGQLRLSYALSEGDLRELIAAFRQEQLADVDRDAQLAQLAEQPSAG